MIALPPVPAQVAHMRCARVPGRDLAPGPGAKIVRIPLRRGRTQLAGCAMPAGRVVALSPVLRHTSESNGELDDIVTDVTADVDAVSGTFAAVTNDRDAGDGGEYEDTTVSSHVFDLRTGRNYAYWGDSNDTDTGDDHEYDLGDLRAIRLDGEGRLAVAYRELAATPQVTIAAFQVDGTRRVLDSGPAAFVHASSLAFQGGMVSWTSHGRERHVAVTEAR